MDKELVEKLDAIGAWKKGDDTEESSEQRFLFSEVNDNMVEVSSEKGRFTHKLKPLNELYVATPSSPYDEARELQLLAANESPIKRMSEDNEEITDSSVVFALEILSSKPEIETSDEIAQTVSRELRLCLSMNDYTRDEVKRAIRKVLNSAKKHNRDSGRKGYLNFIAEFLP